jgi:pimeloyl-ACP methyl ester carboxylesterase
MTSRLWRFGNGLEVETIERGAGPLLFLLPPLGCEAVVGKPLLDLLPGDHRIVAVNFPGYGRAQLRPEGVTIESVADALAALAEAIEPGALFDVVGWSIGGFIAQVMAMRPRARIRSLTLVNTTSHLPTGNAFADVEELQRLLQEDLDRDLARTSGHWDAGELIRWGRKTRSAAVFLHYAYLVTKFDERAGSKDIAAPTLVVGGAEDLPVPAFLSVQLGKSIPRAQLEVLPDVGHFIPVVRAIEFARLVELHLARSRSIAR